MYNYQFNTGELKNPLKNPVTGSGWTWRSVAFGKKSEDPVQSYGVPAACARNMGKFEVTPEYSQVQCGHQ